MPGGTSTIVGEIYFYGDDFHPPVIPNGLANKYLDSLAANGKYIHQVVPKTGASCTNEELREEGMRVAAEFKLRGVGHHDVVVICSKARSEQTAVILGCILVGATVAPMDPSWGQEILKTFILKLKPKMVFCEKSVLSHLEKDLKESREANVCHFTVFEDGPRSFSKFCLKSAQLKTDFKPFEVKDPKTTIAFIMPSQATTKAAKLVALSHYAIAVQTSYVRDNCMSKSEVVATFSNLGKAVEMIISCVCFEYPVTNILMDDFVEAEVCKTIEEHTVDTVWLSYGNARKLSRHEAFQEYSFTKLQSLFIVGSATTEDEMVNLRKLFVHSVVVDCYTMTEMSLLVTCHNLDKHKKNIMKHPNACGHLLNGIKCKVVDLYTFKTVGTLKWGELYLQGPALMQSYYKDPEATKAKFEKDWLKTGDGGQFDKDGNLYVCGKITDYLNIEGDVVPSMLIEEVIASHPAVDEVAVIGNNDFMMACVVKKANEVCTEAHILKHIVEKLPPERRPTKVKILDSIPKTPEGNILRQPLRDQYFHR